MTDSPVQPTTPVIAPLPIPTTQPSRFWRRATVITLGIYTLILLAWLGFQVVALANGRIQPPMTAEDATELAIAQADRILGLLEVVLGIIGLLLPLGLGVVVYIYNQSRATIEENRTTILRLTEQTYSATRDAARSAEIVEELRGRVGVALNAAEEAVKRDKERDIQTTALQESINKQRSQIDIDRITAEKRDERRDEQAQTLQERIEQQRQMVESQRADLVMLQNNIQMAYDQTLALRRQMKVFDVILTIREYEVTLLSDEQSSVSQAMLRLIQMTLNEEDEDEEESVESQIVRRREAVHALATLCYSPHRDAQWLPQLMARVIQHLEQIAETESIPSVRTEARRALRDFNGSSGLNGNKNGATPTRAPRKAKVTASDSPTNAD